MIRAFIRHMTGSGSATERLISLGRIGPVDLWLGDLDAGSEEHDRQVLSAGEIECADRFAFPSDRRRCAAAHALLRHLLGGRLGRASASLEFVLGAHGKPRLAGPTSTHFNLSHCAHSVLLGVSEVSELGVDLERWRQVPDLPELAARVLTTAERRELGREASEDSATRFLRVWTRKEACVKAIGAGLSVEPNTFEAGLESGQRTVRINAPGWRRQVEVKSLDLGPGLIGALAWVR